MIRISNSLSHIHDMLKDFFFINVPKVFNVYNFKYTIQRDFSEYFI